MMVEIGWAVAVSTGGGLALLLLLRRLRGRPAPPPATRTAVTFAVLVAVLHSNPRRRKDARKVLKHLLCGPSQGVRSSPRE